MVDSSPLDAWLEKYYISFTAEIELRALFAREREQAEPQTELIGCERFISSIGNCLQQYPNEPDSHCDKCRIAVLRAEVTRLKGEVEQAFKEGYWEGAPVHSDYYEARRDEQWLASASHRRFTGEP